MVEALITGAVAGSWPAAVALAVMANMKSNAKVSGAGTASAGLPG